MQPYHYPPELFSLLAAAIPLLCRTKQDVFLFFKGAGVRDDYTRDLLQQFQNDRNSINKYQITRYVLSAINDGGDKDLAARREVLKRVVEFEDFSTCWPDDQHKAKGLVADIRKVQNVKDSFTRMSQEREREAEQRRKAYEDEVARVRERKIALERCKKEFFALFAEQDSQLRGKALEGVLNQFFRLHGILIREDFKLRIAGTAGVVEQIDGVVEFDGTLYLVEIKWYKEALGVGEVAQHLVRVFSRANVGGICISASGFTEAALDNFRQALTQKAVFGMELEEIVAMFEAESDLRDVLRSKLQAALIERRPFVRMTPGRR